MAFYGYLWPCLVVMSPYLLYTCHYVVIWLAFDCQHVVMWPYLLLHSRCTGTQEPRMSSKSELMLWGAETKGSDSFSTVIFNVKKSFGKPGAILLESHYANEFFLKSITLELPNESSHVYFPCYTWICHKRLDYSSRPRILFSNQVSRYMRVLIN